MRIPAHFEVEQSAVPADGVLRKNYNDVARVQGEMLGCWRLEGVECLHTFESRHLHSKLLMQDTRRRNLSMSIVS